MARIDIAGQIFGKWHVKYFNDKTHKWICECECGTVREITGGSLRSGRTKSCGCDKHKSHGDITSLIGKKYNNLTVIAFDHFDKRKKDYWKCKCDCGNETIVQGYNLKSGKVKSCGCSYKDCNFEDISGSKFGMLTVDHFMFIKQVEQPYYWYLNGKELKREDCQVHKLKIAYPKLCAQATKGIETYVMESLGARKVYRCGNTRWELDIPANI